MFFFVLAIFACFAVDILLKKETASWPSLSLCLDFFFGDDHHHDEVGQQNAGAGDEEEQDEDQADDGGVHAHVVAETGAHACDHAVGHTAGKFFVVVHSILLCFSEKTYAGILGKLLFVRGFSPVYSF